MARFVLRRLLVALPVLLGITLAVFWVLHQAPGDALSAALEPQLNLDELARLRHAMYLDLPWHRQYLIWLGQLLLGNLGWSTGFNLPVAQLLAQRLPATLLLSVTGELIAILIGIPLGVAAAMRHRSAIDRLLSGAALAGASLPSFFLALLAIKLLALDAGLLPAGGMVTAGAHRAGLAALLDVGRHLLLPALVLGLLAAAGLTRYARAALLGALRDDWVRTARAKGLSERSVIYRHALRTALLPIITLLGLALPALVSGAALVEIVFQWPGVGRLLVDALGKRDLPVLMAANLLFATLTLFGSLLADLAYAAADPRIRYG